MCNLLKVLKIVIRALLSLDIEFTYMEFYLCACV